MAQRSSPLRAWYAELPSRLLAYLPSELVPNFLANKRASYCHFEQLDSASEWTDTLELQHFATFTCLVPTGKRQPGVGHDFVPVRLSVLAWCDKCGEFIWGLFSQAYRCQNCRYTCHYRCQELVTLDCRTVSDAQSSKFTEVTRLSADTVATASSRMLGSEEDDEDLFQDACEELGHSLEAVVTARCDDYCLTANGQKLMKLIEAYNQMASGLAMTLDDDGFSFRGFVRLLINFTRPVSTVDLTEEMSGSFYDFINRPVTCGTTKRTLTSFYLPRNCVKTLHITSDTTTHEMVVSLLNKYHIADNPRKFALYERDVESGCTLRATLKRIPDDACPLRIVLLWGSTSSKRFVLQENETGDIIWDSFEVPELQNFLTILEIEEKQYIQRICEHYRLYKKYLQAEIDRKSAPRPRPTLV